MRKKESTAKTRAHPIPFMYRPRAILYWTFRPSPHQHEAVPVTPPTRSGHGYRLALPHHRRPLGAPAAALLPAGAGLHGQGEGAAAKGQGLDLRLAPPAAGTG